MGNCIVCWVMELCQQMWNGGTGVTVEHRRDDQDGIRQNCLLFDMDSGYQCDILSNFVILNICEGKLAYT